jgi:hypothetical protein
LEGEGLSVGAIVNVRSFRNPHVKTIFERGLWGFKERARRRWSLLERGVRVLLYGDKGIRMAGYVESRYESHEPVAEWVKDPVGYPLRITLSLMNRSVDNIKPIGHGELVSKYGIGLAKRGFRGFGLIVFGSGGTYPLSVFDKIWDEFLRRNGLGGQREPVEEAREVEGLEGYVRDALEKTRKYSAELWTEDNTKGVLIEPLLKLLGWDVYSLDDVERGYKITVGTTKVEVDYALKVNGRPYALLEVKALDKDLEPFVEQVLSYARLKDVRWAVLTNGRELRVYDAARKSQLIGLTLDEYLKERDKVLLLSKEKMREGALGKLADERYHKQAILKWFRESADKIVKEIASSNPELKTELVGKVVREMLEKMEAA